MIFEIDLDRKLNTPNLSELGDLVIEPKVVDRLLNEIGEYDQELLNHCLRVGYLATKTSSHLPFGWRRFITTAALLHDIGKTSLPKSITTGDTKLSEDEWLKMRDHVSIGADRVWKDLGNRQIRYLVGWHHVHQQGAYPFDYEKVKSAKNVKKKESNLWVASKILAGCDQVDALLSPRSYKPAWSFETVASKLVENGFSLPESISYTKLGAELHSRLRNN